MTLFINNLPSRICELDIVELFAEYGAVKHIFFPTDWKTGEGLGFAFVEMSIKAQEEKAELNITASGWIGCNLQIREVSSEESTQNLPEEFLRKSILNRE